MRHTHILIFVFAFSACTIREPSPNLAGQDVHLTLVHTADIHSRIFPYYFAPGQIDKDLGLQPKPGQTTAVVGGIARVGTIIKCIRGFRTDQVCQDLEPLTGPPAARSLHLDSGDIWEGAPVFNTFQGEVEMRAMSQLGLSAMALGNHEFDKGAVNLEEQYQKFGGFPINAANYIFSDPTDPTQPKLADIIGQWTQFNVDGLRVGVIGMGNLSSLEGIIEGGNTLGVRPVPEVEAMADTVELVRPSVDVLVVSSHLGLDEDEGVAAATAEEEDQNTAIAQQGVDVILGGHLHIVLNPPKDLPHFDQSGNYSGHTVLCHSGAFAKYVGRLDLVVHVPSDDEKAQGVIGSVKAYTYTLIPITDDIPMDADLANMLEPYQLKMNEFLDLNQVYAVIGCPSTTTGACPKLTRTDPNGGDSQLGNLVATSMRLREGVEADYGVTNSLGIRADFESGALNLEEMYNVFPFDNSITTMFLSGDETQQMLDGEAARSSERGCVTQMQVSGIYFDMVCGSTDADCQARLCPADDPQCVVEGCARNVYLGDNCRMPDGTFNGTTCKPLDRFGEYRVAVNDYIATGGSGFDVLKRNTTKFNTGISLRDALVDFIRTLPTRCDPSLYSNITGVDCKDQQGETFDCTATCCGHDAQSGPNSCSPTAPQFTMCAQGTVECLGSDGKMMDCTSQCCCHDAQSGPNVCSSQCPAFLGCQQQGLSPQTVSLSPQIFDYTNTACLIPDDTTDPTQQAHDGRIQTIVGAGGASGGPGEM